MKHFAQIQEEFMKMSGGLAGRDTWDSWSYEHQKRYLEMHPESNRKITARPPTGKYLAQFPRMEQFMGELDSKRQELEA